jgi:hypothetical protein
MKALCFNLRAAGRGWEEGRMLYCVIICSPSHIRRKKRAEQGMGKGEKREEEERKKDGEKREREM